MNQLLCYPAGRLQNVRPMWLQPVTFIPCRSNLSQKLNVNGFNQPLLHSFGRFQKQNYIVDSNQSLLCQADRFQIMLHTWFQSITCIPGRVTPHKILNVNDSNQPLLYHASQLKKILYFWFQSITFMSVYSKNLTMLIPTNQFYMPGR